MKGKLFLNYRRVDAEAWADRLFERLVKHFPSENVFMDIDGRIPVGFRWDDWLDDQVAACDLMLVLIGRTWVTEFKARSKEGDRDFVRVEIESALRREIPVVPVFLGDVPAPKAAELPETLRPLLTCQAARLHRMTFDSDAETLIKDVVRSITLASKRKQPRRGWRALFGRGGTSAPDGAPVQSAAGHLASPVARGESSAQDSKPASSPTPRKRRRRRGGEMAGV